MLEEEKNQKNAVVEKVKSLFSKIKNFEQLKYEVFEMRKIFEKTSEDVNKIKEKYSNINDKMKDVNVFMNGNASFENIQGDLDICEITNKLRFILTGVVWCVGFSITGISNIFTGTSNDSVILC